MKSMEKIDAREIRRKLGMNQQQFWSRLGVTQSGGSRYESGRNIPRPVQHLLRLVHVEQIDIRVGLRFSRCMGTEHDDPLRRKFSDELVHVLFDPLSRDHELPSSVHDPKDSRVRATTSMIYQAEEPLMSPMFSRR